MTAVIIAAVIVIAAACVAELMLLAYLLHRDRGTLWRPGQPPPDVPADAPIGSWGAICWRPARHREHLSGAALPD